MLVKVDPGIILTHLSLEQNGHHFTDDIFKCIFMNEKLCISIRISVKFVPKDLFDNKSALVQVMAWHWTGNMPLLETMLNQFTDAYMWHKGLIYIEKLALQTHNCAIANAMDLHFFCMNQ